MLGFVLSLSLTFYIDPVVSGVSSLLLLLIFLVLLYTGKSELLSISRQSNATRHAVLLVLTLTPTPTPCLASPQLQ